MFPLAVEDSRQARQDAKTAKGRAGVDWANAEQLARSTVKNIAFFFCATLAILASWRAWRVHSQIIA
jgi:hypothetical protein